MDGPSENSPDLRSPWRRGHRVDRLIRGTRLGAGTVRGGAAVVGAALLVTLSAATSPHGHANAHPTASSASASATASASSAASAAKGAATSADGGTVPDVSLPAPPVGPADPSTGTGGGPVGGTGPVVPTVLSGGIPVTVLAAYQNAADLLAQSAPSCHLQIALLAGIGKVESNHARNGRLTADGTATPPILGPVLDGSNGTAAIPDTDHGVLDGDTTWDRAVGPMQFIPSTWARWASDGNGDGKADPENVFDASLASARYLCADGRDLATPGGLRAAVLSYNDSPAYLNLVTSWMAVYQGGFAVVADATGPAAVSFVSTRPSAPGPAAVQPPASTTAPTTAPSGSAAGVGTGGNDPASAQSLPSGDPTPTSSPSPTPVTPIPLSGTVGGVLPPVLCTVHGLLGTTVGLLGGLLGPISPTPTPPSTPASVPCDTTPAATGDPSVCGSPLASQPGNCVVPTGH